MPNRIGRALSWSRVKLAVWVDAGHLDCNVWKWSLRVEVADSSSDGGQVFIYGIVLQAETDIYATVIPNQGILVSYNRQFEWIQFLKLES